MSVSPSDLDALRREIDQLDDDLHDLLMQRAAIVSRVAAAKNGTGPFLRPGREAQIIRRLVGRHRGPLPVAALARINREAISALYSLQGAIRVAVQAPEKSVGYWDLARGHFGASVPMSLHRSAATVLRAVSDGPQTVGVLALPQNGETDPWWQQIASTAPGTPRVIARLPFVDAPDARIENLSALVVAAIAPEASGEDVSLVAIGVRPDSISRTKVSELLSDAGLESSFVAAGPSDGAEQFLLFEVPGFLGAEDARLTRSRETAGRAIDRIVRIGAYAKPIQITQPS